jgi:phage tail-like protein
VPATSAPGGTRQVDTGAFFYLEVRGVQMPVRAFFSECTGLQAEYEVFEYQEGGENGFVHKFRGRAKYPNIVLKRGVTEDKALYNWFSATQEEVTRAEGDITLLSPSLETLRKWSFAGAFPVKWQGPNLKANSGEVAIETLEFAHHGFTDAS